MNYTIRDCREADLPQLVILCVHHAAFEKADYKPEGKEAQLKKALFDKSPALFCWIVEINKQPMGYVTYTFNYSTWNGGYFLYMDCLFLEPEARNYGIGAEIMKKLKAVAKGKNCVNVEWQTPEFNKRAIKFYKRIGGTGKEKVRFFLEL